MSDCATVKLALQDLQGKVGVTFEVKRAGNKITVEPNGTTKSWKVLLVGISSVTLVTGGVVEENRKGVLARSSASCNQLEITIS